ncbi:MAG: sulfur carrier protein ThiS [Myxococcales bacterium]|nr:sulfur carrier protein ThiS [Myxococcales bacterium]
MPYRAATVKFQLNGEVRQLDVPVTLRTLLSLLELERRRVAVAVNDRVVPKSRFGEVRVSEGDRVEVIQAVGGG